MTDFITDLAGEADDPTTRFFNLYVAIDNIISSYDDPYDAFSELVQNSVDALRERSQAEGGVADDWTPSLQVEVDLGEQRLTVMDNGIGVASKDKLAVIRPNQSLKRRLRHQGARGEKGAALAFLQFKHDGLTFESKQEDDKWAYRLDGGSSWFAAAEQMVDEHEDVTVAVIDSEVPASPHRWLDEVTPHLDVHSSGTRVSVIFPDDRLSRLFGDQVTAHARLAYLLRTRTAIGYVAPRGQVAAAESFLGNLAVEARVVGPDGSVASDAVPVGYLYPHELAKLDGARKTSRFTNPAAASELMWDFFNQEYIEDNVPEIWANAGFRRVLERYDVTGYFCYAYQNQWFEEVTGSHLDLPAEAADVDPERETLREELLQVNSGFQVAVRSYPTGRRQSFLHRSGAEHKSRTFVVLNFAGPYKPDYGRKNLADEVRPLTNELSKKLISFAHAPTRKDKLKTGQAASVHGVQDVEEARAILKEEQERFRASGVWLNTNPSTPHFGRPASSESEVIAQFSYLVHCGVLPGFAIFGAPASGQIDATFDYYLEKAVEWGYDEVERPLGIHFAEGRDQVFTDQWLEYKISSDLLIDDLKKAAGAPGKKYFTTINLLVCESVDDSTDDFELQELNDDNSGDRRFYGVTHLLRSDQNVEHVIQVICLRRLRELLPAEEEVDEPAAGANS